MDTAPDPQSLEFNQTASDPTVNTGGGLPFGDPVSPPGNFDFVQPGTPVPQTAIPNRAARIDFSLGDKSPGVPSIISTLRDGNEDYLRQQALLQDQADFVNHKQDMMMNLVKNSPNGINPDEASFVDNLSQVQFDGYKNKDTILEQKFGEQVVRSVVSADPNQTVAQAEAKDPEGTHQRLDIYEAESTKLGILAKFGEETRDLKDQQSFLGKGADLIGEMIPIYGSFYLTNIFQKAPLTSLLPGDNLGAQVSYIRSIADPAEYQRVLGTALHSMSNLDQRETLINAIGAYSLSDHITNNLAGAMDVATVGEKPIEMALNGLGKASLSIASKVFPDLVQAASIAGDARVAATGTAMRILKDIPLRDQQIVESKASSIFSPTNWLTGNKGDLTLTLKNDFGDMVQKNQAMIKDLLFNSPSVARTSDDSVQNVFDQLLKTFTDDDRNAITRSILDVDSENKFTPKVETQGPPSPRRIETVEPGAPKTLDITYGDTVQSIRMGNEPDQVVSKVVGKNQPLPVSADGTQKAVDLQHNWLSNTDSMHIHMGKTNGEQFSNKLSAQKFASDYLRNYKLTDDNFVNQNGKWHVRLDLDLPDHLENYKSVIPEQDRISTSLLNGLIGKFRNQSNVLGTGISQARKVVAHGNQKIFDTFQKVTKPIADLSSKERSKLSTILEDNRDYVDYSDPSNPQRGQFYKTLGEFQDAYHDRWNSLPSDKQVKAYYAYIQANQLDGMIRNSGWLRDNIRIGLKDWTEKFDKGEFQFRGTAVSSIPDDDRKTAIAVRDSQTGDLIHIYDKTNISKKSKEILDREIANNAIIVQPERGVVTLPGLEGKQPVSHYVSATPKENRLSLDTAWKDGGHVINDHKFYIKQPQVEDGWFKKDLAFGTAPNEVVAKQRASAIETSRQMMLRDDPNLDNFVSKNIGNGMDAASFKSNFFEGGFDKNTPFYHTPAGIQTIDYHKIEDVVGIRRHPYDQRQLSRAFAGERDTTNIPAFIDEKDVKHVFQDGKLVDPFPTLIRASKSMVDVKLKRDYILKSADLWSQQFSELLEPSTDMLKRDPMTQLYHPQYREHGDSLLKVNAENARKQILGFAGMRTKMDTAFDSLSSRMEQLAYGYLGDEKSRVVSAYLTPLVKNPIQAAKSLAATVKLGLFSPAQLLMQSMSLVTVMSVSPRAGLQGMKAYIPLRFSMHSIVLAEHSVEMAGLMGWNRDHYREMMESMHRSGWSFVHGDQAILDAISTPKIFQGRLGKTIDMGNFFLTEGVRGHRLPAFATAYQEWRTANPGEKFTRSIEHSILSRADDLSNGMSAANNALWQKGIASVPAQFLTFPMRLAEGYWGKAFTPVERIRMFAGYAAVFGIPTAAAGAAGIWPLYDSVKDYLINNNIPYEDNAVQALLNGLPQTMIKMATGENFDFGKRFGEGGISQLRDAWYQNKPLWELATGAPGSVIGDMVSSAMPMMKGIWSVLSEDPKDRTYPLDVQDFMHFFQNITSVNGTTKLWYAMNTQRWMSKYDQPMDGVTNPEAFVMALTGANLESIDDIFYTKEVLKERQDGDSKVMMQMGDLYRRAMLSDDRKQAEQYFTQAKTLAVMQNLSPDKWSQVVRSSFLNFDQNQVDIVERRFMEDTGKRNLTNQANRTAQ